MSLRREKTLDLVPEADESPPVEIAEASKKDAAAEIERRVAAKMESLTRRGAEVDRLYSQYIIQEESY